MENKICLNIGSGKTKIPGFTSIDVIPGVDIQGDFRTLNYKESSVEEIYCSHTLEHFTFQEADEILALFKKWLKPGGVLFLAVPDMQMIFKLLADDSWNEHLLGLVYGNNRYETDVHKSGWCRQSLNEKLSEFGFKVIEEFEPFVVGEDGALFDASSMWYEDKFRTHYTISINFKCVLEKLIGT